MKCPICGYKPKDGRSARFRHVYNVDPPHWLIQTKTVWDCPKCDKRFFNLWDSLKGTNTVMLK